MDDIASSSANEDQVNEMGGDNGDDSFLNSNLHNSTQKTDKSFNKVNSIDKLNKSQSKSKENSKSQANISNLQREVILEEHDMDPLQEEGEEESMAIIIDEEPEEVAQLIPAQMGGDYKNKRGRKKFTNDNNSSDEEGSNAFPYESQQETDQMPSFIPANAGLYNNRRVMTAPQSQGTRSRANKGTSNPQILGGAFHQTFVESDLMKAANIYQQFDKKGNLYENRLYAKTSINQAKFNKDQNVYDTKMANQPDEMCRINNGSQFQDQSGIDLPEKSFAQNQLNRSYKDGSIHNMTQNASVSINEQIRSSTQSVTNAFGPRTQTGFQFGRAPNSALSPRGSDLKNTQLSGGTIRGGTFSKADNPKITRKSLKSSSTLMQQVEAQNTLNNKDMGITSGAKSQSNAQLTSIKKSLNRLSNLNAYNSAWSRRDYDIQYVTGGIGAKQNTFRHAQNLQTNEPKMFGEKGFNDTTTQTFRPRKTDEMVKSFYHYYQTEPEGEQVKQHDLPDKSSAFAVGRYINQTGKNFYGKQLDNKGRSKVAFTERDHTAGYSQSTNKIQKKAYRANTQSRQVDGLYKEGKFTQRPSYMNYTRSDYNILRPCQNVKQLSVSNGDPRKLMESMRSGKCHQIYGISDFNQNNRQAGLKYHEKYQTAYGKSDTMFRRTNGEFTIYKDALKQCNF